MGVRSRYSIVLTVVLIIAAIVSFAKSGFSMTGPLSQEKSMGLQEGKPVADLAYLVDTSKAFGGTAPALAQPVKASPTAGSFSPSDEAVSILFLGITLLLVAGITRKRAIQHHEKKQGCVKNAQCTR